MNFITEIEYKGNKEEEYKEDIKEKQREGLKRDRFNHH